MKLLVKLAAFFVFNIHIDNSNGARILGVFPVGLKSHDIFCQSVMTLLANRGHKVDVIISRVLENPPENYTTILNIHEILPHKIVDLNPERIFLNYSTDIVKFVSLYFGNKICEILADDKMQQVLQNLKKKHDYDLFITEAFAANCFMGIAHFLNIPMMTLSTQTLYPWVEEAIGNPPATAIHPNILSPLTEINSFWDRLQNTLQNRFNYYRFHYLTEEIQTEIMMKYFSSDVPNVRELPKTSMLTLVNTHFSFNGIRPLTPALIEVGGLHISQDQSKFTPELKKWMDDGKHGVVYFTIGTIASLEFLPKKIILTLFASFARLKPVRFLIRMNNVSNLLVDAPENVKMLPWIPQIPVLGHKNTKAFMTHCGLLSSQEAIYFGVPVIGFPLILDQFLNLQNLKRLNMAVQLDILNVSQPDLVNALTIVLNNSTYRDAAKRASSLFKDRPLNVEDTAVYWIEYVIRNGGILKSPAVNLHWIQKELLDVYGFLMSLIILILYFIAKFVKLILNIKSERKWKNMKEKVN